MGYIQEKTEAIGQIVDLMAGVICEKSAIALRKLSRADLNRLKDDINAFSDRTYQEGWDNGVRRCSSIQTITTLGYTRKQAVKIFGLVETRRPYLWRNAMGDESVYTKRLIGAIPRLMREVNAETAKRRRESAKKRKKESVR